MVPESLSAFVSKTTHCKVTVLISFLVVSRLCTAGSSQLDIPIKVENLEIIDHNTHELDLNALATISTFSQQYDFQMSNYVPLKGLPANDSGNTISRKILQQSAQHFFEEHKSDIDGSVIGTTARMNSNMKTQIGDGGKDSMQIRARPVEGKAEVVYSAGLPVKSVLSYNAWQGEAEFEMSKDLWGKTFAITHSHSSSEDKQMFGVRWSW